MNRNPRNADILVLESDWGEDLIDTRSTRPFVEGLARALEITAVFRTFHSGRDLEHWMHQVFLSKGKPEVVYISTHGSGRCLYPSLATRGVNLRAVLASAVGARLVPAPAFSPAFPPSPPPG